MAFKKRGQDFYEEENDPAEELEEERPTLFGKATRSLKGLFSRGKDDYDDYDDYDDEDDYDFTGVGSKATSEDDGEMDWSALNKPMSEKERKAEENAFARFAAAGSGKMTWLEENAEEDYAAEDYAAEDYAAGDYAAEDYAAEDYATEDYAAEDYAAGDYATGDYATGDYVGEDYDFGTDEVQAEDFADYDGYGDYDLGGEYAAGDYEAAPEGEEKLFGEEDGYDYGEKETSREKRSVDSLRELLDRYLIPGLGVAALCAVAAIAFAVITLLGGRDRGETKAPSATDSPAISVPTATPTPAELQAAGQTPEPGGAETSATPAVTGQVKAGWDDNHVLVPVGDSAVVPKRSTVRSLDSFATSTHIGNSFVEGMQLWSDIDSCHYVCADGVSLDNMIGNYLYFVTVRNYDSIYLTLGINEIGWPTNSFIEKYEKVIDYIRSDATAQTRQATIYVTSVFPTEQITETVAGESGQTIHKSTILEFNEQLKEMCLRKGCWYLDVYSELAGEDGYLPADVAADDHIHFEKTGYRIWTDYLRDHYVDETMVG